MKSNQTALNESVFFFISLLLIGALFLNGLILSYGETFIDNSLRSFVPGSAPTFSTIVGSLLLLLTFTIILLGIINFKDESNKIDASLILSGATILSNYPILFYLTYKFEGSGKILVGIVFGLTLGCLIVTLLFDMLSKNKVYLFILAQAFLIVLFALSTLITWMFSYSTSVIFNFGNGNYILNPPIVAALLLFPHFINSFLNPSSNRTLRQRILDIIVYVVFGVTLAIFVPETITARWMAKVDFLYKFLIISFYCMFFFLSFEYLRPVTFDVRPKRTIRLILKHVLILTTASSLIGFIIYLIGANEGTRQPIHFIFIGHAFVGLSCGIIIPIWYKIYQKHFFIRIRKHLLR